MQGSSLICLGLLVLISIPIVRADLAERRIPNAWNLALAVAGLAVAMVRSPHWRTLLMLALDLTETLSLFLVLAWITRALRKQNGLGMGDIKFLAAASLWVGFGGAVVLFVLASLLAVIAAVAAAPWKGLDLKTPRPFGPMLAAALLVVVGVSGLAG